MAARRRYTGNLPTIYQGGKMSKRLYIFIAVLVVLSMALSACGAATPQPTAVSEPTDSGPATSGEPEACAADAFGCSKIEAGQTVKIGMGGPMTGDNAAYGIDAAQAARIAISDAGQFNGFSFELDAQDDGGTPEGGAAVANKFVSDPQIVAIEGHIFSGATGAAMPIYEEAGLVMLSPSATNPGLTQTGSKVFNRGVFTDAVQGKFAAEYINNTLKLKKVLIIHDGTTYGQGLAQVTKDELSALGTEVLAFQAITPGEGDYSSVLAGLASLSPEIIFFGGYAAEAAVIVNQMDQAGMPNTVFFGDDGTYGTDFIDRTGANGEGSYATSLVPPDSEAVTKYNAAYEAAYGQEPGKLSPYSWTGYDAAAVLIVAIKSVAIVGGDGNLYIPRTALIDAVRGTKDYKGLSGMISCDSTGECGSSGPVFYIVKDGDWVEAPK
jgi:branched-chain amino acid transport system substrate-binding protein